MLPTCLSPISQILGALSADASIFEKLGFQFNGLIVVFTALGSIWLLLEIIGIGFKRLDAAKTPAALEPAAAGEHLDPATVVAIAAAVHNVLGHSARVVSITPEHASDWAREGRRQIFSSHQVR